ncbi:MAG: hypothetical protein ABIQ16_20535 [Polyangiaceae bacterium]
MGSRCDSKFPWYVRLNVYGLALWTNCHISANTMYEAVRAKGENYFTGRVCVNGRIWPDYGWNGTCSTYEYFDSAKPLCSGADGERADGSIGPNWSGCRGTGCAGCSDALLG